MNREIKFRAWYIFDVKPKMVYPNNGDFIGWHAPSNWNKCYKVMLFTGIQDKNGKDIYEGDICVKPYLGSETMRGVIEWKHAGLVFQSIEDPSKQVTGWQNLISGQDIEVIGNIYETPHLLTQWK